MTTVWWTHCGIVDDKEDGLNMRIREEPADCDFSYAVGIGHHWDGPFDTEAAARAMTVLYRIENGGLPIRILLTIKNRRVVSAEWNPQVIGPERPPSTAIGRSRVAHLRGSNAGQSTRGDAS